MGKPVTSPSTKTTANEVLGTKLNMTGTALNKKEGIEKKIQ